MPSTLTVDHQKKTTTTVATGPIAMVDIREHLFRERNERGLAYHELIDASGATAVFSSSDVRETVEILRKLGREGALGPTAVVVSNDVTYGMFRMLQMLLDDVCDLRPFRSGERDMAERWLAGAAVRTDGGAAQPN